VRVGIGSTMATLRLEKLLREHPYLDQPAHALNTAVVDLKAAIDDGDFEKQAELLDRIEIENDEEEKALHAAFNRFDNSRRGVLGDKEVKIMCEYLGFPTGDEEIRALMDVIDKDRSGTVSFEEFNNYVGYMGGSDKLFEARRRRLGMSADDGDPSGDPNEIRKALLQCGIDQDAQISWRLVVPPSEFYEAAKLTGCQMAALKCIRKLAKINHERALPELQTKVARLGHSDSDLWMTLAWIRELAPIIVHVGIEKMLQWMERDTHYRNQFETGASGGLLNTKVREKWERDLFMGKYDGAKGFDRPKYGVLNVMNDYRGVVKCAQYGESYMVLKDARLRCTFSPEDSANLKAERLAVLDFYAHVLNEYSNDELKETLKVANSKEAAVLGESEKVGSMKYKETQIHGEVCFEKHVERLVAHQKFRGGPMDSRIKAVCRKFGWAFSWMDEEQRRMREEDMHKLGAEAWHERLKEIESAVGEIEVPEGFCKKGCGRPVCPGVSRSGRPWQTCCRGCVMGFGHDLRCGAIDPTKVGPGLCKNGCGRPVAPGRDAKGRPLMTCCRGCALGKDHDATCGRSEDSPKPGLSRSSRSTVGAKCKMGCGRDVAPADARGRRFDTCCRPCAQGRGHAADCDERAGG